MVKRALLLCLSIGALAGNSLGQDFLLVNKTNHSVPPDPYCVRPADVNNDGNIDLITANRSAATITVLMGNGDGTFQDSISYPAGLLARDLAIADFDRDGYLDIVVAGDGSDSISVLMNHGDGTFPLSVFYAAGYDDLNGGRCRPWHLTTADFNADSYPDLAVTMTNRSFEDPVPNDSLFIYLNAGDGTFVKNSAWATHEDPRGICSGNFNSDGFIDIAVACESNFIDVFTNNGDSTFVRSSITTLARPFDICTADFDGDLDLDLCILNAQASQATIYKNNGSGAFTIGDWPSLGTIWSFNSADMDGDDDIDLLAAAVHANIAANDGTANFDNITILQYGGNPQSICAADFDNDGDNDLALANTPDNFITTWENITQCPGATISSPNAPIIPALGRVGYSYLCSTTGSIISCDENIEYRFDFGDGTILPWTIYKNIEHTWSSPDTYNVVVQARGQFHTDILSDWSPISEIVIIPDTCSITDPNTPTGDTLCRVGRTYTYSVTGAECNCEDPVEYRFNWGDGGITDWSTTTSQSHTWSVVAYLFVRVQARCIDHPDTESDWSLINVIVIDDTCTVTTPNAPEGPINSPRKINLSYSASGSTTSCGDPVQYRFDWGNGTISKWYGTSSSGTYAWPANGIYEVKAQARCSYHTSELSGWSDPLTVTIEPPPDPDPCPGEVVTAADAPNGPTDVYEHEPVFYHATGASSSCGHPLQYRFNWGDGSFTTWSTIDSASHAWATENYYNVIVKARCQIHPEVEANWSPIATVTVSPSLKDSGALLFGNPVEYPVGANPSCVRPADINNDGYIDLVATNGSSASISVLLGNGNLTFDDAVDYPVGSSPCDLTIADFTGDTYPDIGVVCRSKDSIYVLLNNGNGTFGSSYQYYTSYNSNYGSTNRPLRLASGDFNGDGYFDIVVVSSDEAEEAEPLDISFLLMNNGDGTFASARLFTTQNLSRQNLGGVCTGDFDRNGYMDFAVGYILWGGRVYLNYGYDYYTWGDLQFGSRLFDTDPYFRELITADLDNDGDLDLATFGFDWDQMNLMTLRNDGTGSFSVRSERGCGGATSIYPADINNDDYVDILLTNSDVMVFLNGGSANMVSSTSIYSGGSPKSVCAADFDRDGDNDIAIANSSVDAIVILPNTIGEEPREELFQPTEWHGLGAEVYDIATGDFDADSVPDIAYTTYNIISGIPGARFDERISILAREGSDQLHGTAAIYWESYRDWYNEFDSPFFYVCAGDFNGDGADDIVASETFHTLTVLNTGTGDFGTTRTLSYDIKGRLCAADVNNDGYEDVIIAGGSLRVFISDGTGGFIDSVMYGFSGNAYNVMAGDIDNDGDDDVIVASSASTYVFNNENVGLLSETPVTLSGGGKGVCLPDLNNDGWLDIATCGGAAKISYWMNNGDGSFGSRNDVSPGGQAIDICAVHIDDDAYPELAVIDYTENTVSLYLNDGLGDFTYQNKYPVGSIPKGVCAVDVENDGDEDIIVAYHGGYYFYSERGGYCILRNKLYDVTAADTDESDANLPDWYALEQNFPNPFNPTTTIAYSLPRASHIMIDIFNIIGQKVRTLVDAQQPAGEYEIVWDGRDASRQVVASGIYLYRMQTEHYSQTKKMTLIK